MRWGSPTGSRQNSAAYEGDGVVDDDELLMMRCPGRMPVVEPKRQSPMRAPIELVDGKPFALCRIEHREIPRQDIAAQSASFGDQRIQEIADRLGKSVACAVRHELHPAVDVPAHDEERP